MVGGIGASAANPLCAVSYSFAAIASSRNTKRMGMIGWDPRPSVITTAANLSQPWIG